MVVSRVEVSVWPVLQATLKESFPSFTGSGIAKDGVAGNLRRSLSVRGSASLGLDDDVELGSEPQAACCLITRADGKVLAVSRKDDPNDFGMPGGKVDPGETPEEAAARELEEETGFVAVDLNQVFDAVDSHGFHTFTFACKIEGEYGTEELGRVRWVDPGVLLQGSFAEYNERMFRHLGR